MQHIRSGILMIPGPVEVPDDILAVFRGRPVAHYGKDWTSFYLDTVEKTSLFFGTRGLTFLVPGSGSLGMEMLASTFCYEKHVLVLSNGFFADRYHEIISHYARSADILDFGFGCHLDTEKVDDALTKKDYDAIALVHVETSSGILNPLQEISALAKKNGALVLLDAVASAGVEEIDMDRWEVDAVVTASQKGFECPAGLAIICINERLLALLEKKPATHWYTDLSVWRRFHEKWHDWHPFPVTLPTNLIKAYAKSLENIIAGGPTARFAMFAKVAETVRTAMKRFGFTVFPESRNAHGLTVVSSAGLCRAPDIVRFMREERGIIIAGTLSSRRDELFRIGHLSRGQIAVKNMTATFTGLAEFLRLKGFDVPEEEIEEIALRLAPMGPLSDT